MSDKEANFSGRRNLKAAGRIKKKKQKLQEPIAPEAKETASEKAEGEQLSPPPAVQEADLAPPESALQASGTKETPADEALLDANQGKVLGSDAPEESAFTEATSKEERVGLEKIPQKEARLEAEGERVERSKTRVREPVAGGPPERSALADNGYSKLRLWLRVLVIGLVVVAVGNAYYARTLANQEREARQALAEKLTEQLATRVETQVDSQLEARLPGREESFQEAITRLAQENKKHAEEVEEVQEKVAALETTLGVLRTEAQMSPEAEDWDIAEVAYLLRIANERLQLERDVKTTLVALQAADQILRKAADPALTPVRSQLAEEINALKALPTPDIGGMALSLSNLTERVRDLEFKEAEVEETAAAAETRASDEALGEDDVAAKARRFLNLIWDDLKHLVMVRRRGKGDEGLPILPPEERYFLYRNLELELEAARLSLLRNDEEGFRQSLHLAQDWLQTYFQGAEAEFMRETLAELAQTSIRPSLPNISGSLKTLNRVWSRARSRTTGGS
jgi:uroporphyrin-III C-methyltransferase